MHLHKFREYSYIQTISYKKDTWYGSRRGTYRVYEAICAVCGLPKLKRREE